MFQDFSGVESQHEHHWTLIQIEENTPTLYRLSSALTWAGCVNGGVCGDVWRFWSGWDCRSTGNCLAGRVVGGLWRSAGMCHVRPAGCLWGSRGWRWGWRSAWGDPSGNLACWCRWCAAGGGCAGRQADVIFRCQFRTGCLCSCCGFQLFSCRGSGRANSMKNTWSDAESVCWLLLRRQHCLHFKCTSTDNTTCTHTVLQLDSLQFLLSRVANLKLPNFTNSVKTGQSL